MAPRKRVAREPSIMLAGSATAATLMPAMSKPQLLRVLVEPPETSAMNRVQFPLGLTPLKEVNRAEGLVESKVAPEEVGGMFRPSGRQLAPPVMLPPCNW